MKTTTHQTGIGCGRVIRFAPALLIALPFAAQSAPETPEMFNKHIAPIIYKNCDLYRACVLRFPC
jgi:hypothetical protein